MNNGNKLYPGVLAGTAIGVLSSLPFVNLANCCCVWIFGGGMLASYLYQANQDDPISVNDALAVGAIAAVAGAVVGLVVSIPVHYIAAPIMQRFMLQVLESSQDVPAEVRDVLENVSLTSGGLIVSFIFSLVLYGFFVPAGALVGGLLFQKKTPGPGGGPGASAFGPAVAPGSLPMPPPLPPREEVGRENPEASAASGASSAPGDSSPSDTASGGPDDDEPPPSSTPPSQPPPPPTV